MCTIVFATQNHPRYPLIFAGNRDEFYGRPTRPARFWDQHPNLLAGKDLEAGGTWLGINLAAEFATVTNFRNPDMQKEDPPSRGQLPVDYLTNPIDAETFLSQVDKKADRYNGFNLLLGTGEQLLYYSNQDNRIRRVEPGVHGLSNHFLNSAWPKVQKAKSEFSAIIEKEEIDPEAIFELLRDREKAPDDELPDTGVPLELERAVSSIFVQTEKYGTRSSTVLLIDRDGSITFIEQRYKPGTTQVNETNRFEFETADRR